MILTVTPRCAAAMRAASNDFDPYKQVINRISQLDSIGHPTDKIELIVMGGTFPSQDLDYQEYFVRERHDVEVSSIHVEGIEAARPAPGVLDAITGADAVVIAPSNPVVSIDPVLAVPDVRDAVAARRDEVVAISPIVGGAALKGPADRLLNTQVATVLQDPFIRKVGVFNGVEATLGPVVARTIVQGLPDAGGGDRIGVPRIPLGGNLLDGEPPAHPEGGEHRVEADLRCRDTADHRRHREVQHDGLGRLAVAQGAHRANVRTNDRWN